MPVQTIQQIANNFQTEDKPTEEQFYNWLLSFWHKNELIPMSSIEGLDAALQAAGGTASSLAVVPIDGSQFETENQPTETELNAYFSNKDAIGFYFIDSGSSLKAVYFYTAGEEKKWYPFAEFWKYYSKGEVDQIFENHLEADNPHEIDKDDVGLGNVDNTSDEDKPVSNAQQAAFYSKLNTRGDNLADDLSETEQINILSKLGVLVAELMKLTDWTADGKFRSDKLPDMAISDVVENVSENTIVDFASNEANYDFQTGDTVPIVDGDGNKKAYIYKGGDRSDVESYLEINSDTVPKDNVIGLQIALDDLLQTAKDYADTNDKHLGKVNIEQDNEERTYTINQFLKFMGDFRVNSLKFFPIGDITSLSWAAGSFGVPPYISFYANNRLGLELDLADEDSLFLLNKHPYVSNASSRSPQPNSLIHRNYVDEKVNAKKLAHNSVDDIKFDIDYYRGERWEPSTTAVVNQCDFDFTTAVVNKSTTWWISDGNMPDKTDLASSPKVQFNYKNPNAFESDTLVKMMLVYEGYQSSTDKHNVGVYFATDVPNPNI